MTKKTWEEVEHKFHPLWLTGLSATVSKSISFKEIEQLAKLKDHFSLLDTDFDEVDSVKVKYYNIWPNKSDIFLVIPIVLILIYLFVR